MFCAYGVLMPGFLLYDDACHLKSRMMSLMGSYWESAAGMCIAILIDKFHFSNHVNPWCVGALSPFKFKGLNLADADGNPLRNGVNTESCEQRFRIMNKYKDTVRQKPGGSFRFFTLRLCDLLNCQRVHADPTPSPIPRAPV
mmetsp:Transcript_14621/g.38652  ORF Transcript_14621/g.38652 Transcript_14621/m.38652 type:complete len:142 (+) Transcript_14621:85-510(+)